MGLAVCVGLLADFKENDPEALEDFEETFIQVNQLLSAAGLQPHTEPQDVESWDAEMLGYSGLHYLRRLAAYVDSGAQLPGPGGDDSASDKVLEAYFDNVGGRSSFLKSLFGKKHTFKREFDHLIVHSDAEGYYVPQDFSKVIFADEGQIPGGMIGSVQRLLHECERLAQILKIPASIGRESEELWEASEVQGEGDALWQQYGVESFTCVGLTEACKRSLATGAAIVFT